MRLAIFLLLFLTVSGSVHAYAFFKAKKAFCPGRKGSLGLLIFLAFMVFIPILIRLSEGIAPETLSRILAYAGYTWMGVLFLFICVHLSLDAVRFLFRILALRIEGLNPILSSKILFEVCAVVSMLLALYGYFEAQDIHTERIILKSSKIPVQAGKIRIVQISDVHLGLLVMKPRLQNILRKVSAEKPDILVSTGDLVDGRIDAGSGMPALFRGIDARFGKYAVTGNHEYYAGIERSAAFIEQAGFTLLRGEEKDIQGMIRIVCVEDPTEARYSGSPKKSEEELLKPNPDDRFVLLLKHRPLLNPKSLDRFDLQLSGHVHKGQIFPFTLIIKMFYPIDAGLLSLPRNRFLYVSRGSGTWGPPMRLLAPPEVTVIDLFPELHE